MLETPFESEKVKRKAIKIERIAAKTYNFENGAKIKFMAEKQFNLRK